MKVHSIKEKEDLYYVKGVEFVKRRLILGCLFLILGFALVITGCGNQDQGSGGDDGVETIVMRYTHGLGLDDPHHWVALRFQELVYEYSNGRVEVQIFPADQLGSEQRGFQDVQNGVVQATSLAINNASVFSPSLGFLDLPYIFLTKEEFYEVIDDMWDELNERMIAESGNKAIIWFEQGFRHITNSVRPIETIEDLRGLRIRVPPNPMMLGAFEAWGSNATPMAWGEVFNGLQYGIIDGQENPHGVNNSMSFYEVQSYITEIHYKMWIGPVVVNNQWFQRQDADIQEAILRAGREVSVEVRDVIVEMEQAALENLLAHGMINFGPPRDEEVWVELAMAIWPDFYDTIAGTEMLERAMGILGREVPQP